MANATETHTATCELPDGDADDCAAAWLWHTYADNWPAVDLDELSDAVAGGCACRCHGRENES